MRRIITLHDIVTTANPGKARCWLASERPKIVKAHSCGSQ
jgi:hypothetical protein